MQLHLYRCIAETTANTIKTARMHAVHMQLLYCSQSENVSTTANYLLLLPLLLAWQPWVPMHAAVTMAIRMASMMIMITMAITILSFRFFFCRNKRQGRGAQRQTHGEVLLEEKGINQTFCDGCMIMQHLRFP